MVFKQEDTMEKQWICVVVRKWQPAMHGRWRRKAPSGKAWANFDPSLSTPGGRKPVRTPTANNKL